MKPTKIKPRHALEIISIDGNVKREKLFQPMI
jgi:hypothetical protein